MRVFPKVTPSLQTSAVGWEMRVRDVFRFSDGRTIFVGPVERAPSYIAMVGCDLLFDGEPIAQIDVSEELPERPEPSSSDDRAVGTSAEVSVDGEMVVSHDIRLRERAS